MIGCLAVAACVLAGPPGAGQAGAAGAAGVVVAQATDDGSDAAAATRAADAGASFADPFDDDDREPVYDPWEPFNTKMFGFNHRADIALLRPAARAYNAVVSPHVQDALTNMFYNAGFVARVVNNIFQGKFGGAVEETLRVVLNSTMGVGGLFDIATPVFESKPPPAEDTGQTLAVHGVPSGPYLVLPMLPPLTVRAAVGFVGDTLMDPVNYILPFLPNLGLNATERVNFRSRNLKTFEGIAESSVDLYGAARAGYLDRRARDILE